MRLKKILALVLLSLPGVLFSLDLKLDKMGPLAGKIQKPTATLEKFDIKQISLRDITFTFDIGINNPYPVDLKLDGVELDFSVESNKVFHATAAQGFIVKAKGKQVTSFDVTLSYDSIIGLIRDYASRDYLRCDTDVLIKIPLPKIKGLPPTVDFSFKFTQKIPAIKPNVSIARFTVTPPSVQDVKASLEKSAVSAVKSLDAKKVQGMLAALVKGGSVPKPEIKPEELDLRFKVGFDIVMQNEAKAPLDFTSLELQVNSNQLITGGASSLQKTGTTTVIRVTNEFSSKSLNPSVLAAFKTGAGTFGLSGSTTLQLPPAVLPHPLRLEFKEEGRFKLR